MSPFSGIRGFYSCLIFTLLGLTQLSVLVAGEGIITAPKKDQVLCNGTTRYIEWEGIPASISVFIYAKSNGASVLIGGENAATNSHEWQIGANAPVTAGEWYIEINDGVKVLATSGIFNIAFCDTNGTVVGDPHVRTLDKMTVTYLGCGDQTMLETSDDHVVYQARHCLRESAGTSTCAVALMCGPGADRLEVYTLRRTVKLLVGGKEVEATKAAEYTANLAKVERKAEGFKLQCTEGGIGVELKIREAADYIYLDALVNVPQRYYGKTRGLLGSWDGDRENDIQYADGSVWQKGHGFDYVSALEHPTLDEVQASWTVKGDKSLFSLTESASDAECRAKSRRFLLSTAVAPDGALVREAHKLCKETGLTGVNLHTCVFDFLATGGDLSFVRNSVRSAADFGH